MPRTRYQITEDDYQHASFYLSGRLRNYGIEFAGSVNATKAERQYYQSIRAKSRKKKAESLNHWAEKYLSSEEWSKLKTAVRKRRQRWENQGDQKTVTISAKAHQLLSRIANRDEVTFSEVLEHYLAKAMRSRRGSARSRRQ